MTPPRGHSQLDEISTKIGELGAYVHEHRHGVNNLSTKFDALSLDLAKRVEALDVKISARIEEMSAIIMRRVEAMERRIDALEAVNDKRTGALGLVEWFLRNWPAVVGFLVLLFVIMRSNGQIP